MNEQKGRGAQERILYNLGAGSPSPANQDPEDLKNSCATKFMTRVGYGNVYPKGIFRNLMAQRWSLTLISIVSSRRTRFSAIFKNKLP